MLWNSSATRLSPHEFSRRSNPSNAESAKYTEDQSIFRVLRGLRVKRIGPLKNFLGFWLADSFEADRDRNFSSELKFIFASRQSCAAKNEAFIMRFLNAVVRR